MEKIIYTNSAMIINDYDLGDCQTLEWNFKTYDPITHSVTFFGMYYDAENRRLFLPRGIDKFFVETKLKSVAKDDSPLFTKTKHCHGFEKINVKMKYFPKDERQKEALRFMLCADNYEINKYKSQFSVNLPTGAGKTYCSIATIVLENIRSCIISSQSGLLDQWKKCILEYTDCKPNDVCKLEGSQSLLRIINGKSSNMDRKIYLITHATLKSFGDTYGWDKVEKLFEALKIGIKVFDEAHQNFANMCMVDFYTNVYRTYYITATPTRSSKDEIKVFELYLRNVPSIDLWDQESDPHTKYIAIKYNSCPKFSDINECSNKFYGLDRNKYCAYLMNNPRFWMMFDYIFNLVEKAGGKALFFIQTNEAILKVKDRIISLYPEYKNDVGIYTSITEEKDRITEKNKRFILSTTKSAGAGEDIKGLKYTVVLAETFKSSLLAQQTLGRTRDPDTYYIELVDIGFKQLVRWYSDKKPIFSKYALSTREMKIQGSQVQNIAEDARIDRYNRMNRVVEFNCGKTVDAVTFLPQNENTIDCVCFLNGGPRD